MNWGRTSRDEEVRSAAEEQKQNGAPRRWLGRAVTAKFEILVNVVDGAIAEYANALTLVDGRAGYNIRRGFRVANKRRGQSIRNDMRTKKELQHAYRIRVVTELAGKLTCRVLPCRP